MVEMITAQTVIEIKKDDLIASVQKMRDEGYVFSLLSVTKKDGFELTYSFEKEYNMVNYRFVLPTNEEEVESICKIYAHSYIYENEAKDLYGIKIMHMDMDFKGTLYKTSVDSPFAQDIIAKEKDADKGEK